MIKPSFIPLPIFCERYDVKSITVEAARSDGRLPEVMFRYDRHTVLIDTAYFNKRMDFRQKMWLMSHELYYELREIYSSQSKLSRLIAKLDGDDSLKNARVWDAWMHQGMWMIDESKVIMYPRPKDYLFVRYARWLLSIRRRNEQRRRKT